MGGEKNTQHIFFWGKILYVKAEGKKFIHKNYSCYRISSKATEKSLISILTGNVFLFLHINSPTTQASGKRTREKHE